MSSVVWRVGIPRGGGGFLVVRVQAYGKQFQSLKAIDREPLTG